MWPAFPTSDYYGPSAPPSRHQQTTCLAAADPDGRQVGAERTVPTFTTDRLTGSVPSFSPCRLVHGYPAARHRGPRRPTTSRLSLPVVGSRSALLSRPSTRFPAGPDFLRGFHHWFLRSYTSPSCLPSPGCLAVPARPGVVEAAPTFPLASEVRLPPASSACCDRPLVGLFPPPGHVAPRGAPSHRSPPVPPRDLGRRWPSRARAVVGR